jgi:uncharacterized protein involved in outer membrane biogenesis
MKSKRGLKILAVVVAAVIVLLVLASVVVKIIFTKDKLLSLLVPRIESTLDRKVEIEDVSVSIWGGLGVDVQGMTVWNKPGFFQNELFKFDQLSIRVKFWPLLRKRIEVKKLILENPQINLETSKDGISNFADLIKGEAERISMPAAFDQLQITNGKIVYLDDKNKRTIILRQFEESAILSLDEKMENAQISGKITVPSIDLSLPGYSGKLPPLTLSLEHDVNLNMPGQFLDVTALKIGIAQVRMDVKGRVERLNTSPVLDLKVDSESIPLKDVFASLPREEGSPLNQLSTSGDVSITASIQGGLGKELTPEIQGKVTIKDARIDFASVPKPFTMPYGEMNFNNRSVSFFSSEAKLADAPMELKLVLEDFADPSLTSELRTKLNLAVLGELVELPQQTRFAGHADINIKAYGKTKKPEKMILSGRVDLQKVEAATPALGVPVRNLDAGISLKDGNLDISKLSLSMGKSSLNLQGKLYGAVPYILSSGKEKPLFSFNLNSSFIDLDEIFPVSGKGEVKPASPGADAAPLPPINASGQIFIQRGRFRGIEFADFSSRLEVTGGLLELENIVSTIYSGTVGGKVSTDLKQPEHLQFDMNLTANQIEANDFMSRFAALDDRLFGKLNLNATFSGEGNRLEDIHKSILAQGTVNFTDGKLVNWELVDSLSSFVGARIAREQGIRTLRNSFRIENGRVWFDDFSAATKDGDFELAGSVGLDGSLDYELTLILSPELSARFSVPPQLAAKFGALGDLSRYLKNEQGRVVLDVRISGQAKRPRFAFDASKVEKRITGQVKAKLEEKEDGLKEEVTKKAEDLLKDLFKKKKK